MHHNTRVFPACYGCMISKNIPGFTGDSKNFCQPCRGAPGMAGIVSVPHVESGPGSISTITIIIMNRENFIKALSQVTRRSPYPMPLEEIRKALNLSRKDFTSQVLEFLKGGVACGPLRLATHAPTMQEMKTWGFDWNENPVRNLQVIPA